MKKQQEVEQKQKFANIILFMEKGFQVFQCAEKGFKGFILFNKKKKQKIII